MRLNLPFASALIAAAATAAMAIPSVTFAQSALTPAGKDWPYTTGNLGSQGYSSLTQITKANVKHLDAAWVTHTAAEPVTSPVAGPGSTDTGQQTTPIVVDGIMYANTAGGGVIALDGATGAVKWKWFPSVAANGYGPARTQRGVTLGDGKIFTTAAGNRVVALNKDTGAVIWATVPVAPSGETIAGVSKVRPMYHDGLVFMGNNDNNRGAMFALRAGDGSVAWSFFSTYPSGTSFTDVNGKTVAAGDSFTTDKTPNDTPNNCYLTAGATPWQGGTVDPELGMIYVAFGNVRSCSGAQNGAGRPGDNLFGSSVVALDLKTGAYKWHFQAVRHDIWDMDNALPPVLADVGIDGKKQKVMFYGSKSGFQFTLDRATGKPALPIEDRAVPGDTRSKPALTQPFPLQSLFMPLCVSLQNLGSAIPGDPNRMVPNWNGYQAEPDPANPGQLRLTLKTPNYLTAEEPFMVGPERKGCMYDGAYDGFVYMSMTSQNGGNDMTNTSVSPRLNMRYIGLSYAPVGHPLSSGGNGLRQLGGYQTGAILGVNNSTGQVVWYKPLKLDLSRQHNPLVTGSDLLFHTQMDGFLVARDAATGEEVWRFQMGAASQAGTIAYEINGEQYIATTNMAGGQPYSQGGNGDAIWAFKLGGTAKYYTGTRANPTIVSGSSEAPDPLPIATWRREVGNTAGTGMPANTVYTARSNATATATKDSTDTAAMVPSRLTVAAGTTVTFTNPDDTTFGVAGSGNVKEHCVTQYFEGKFNFRLQPGQSAQYTFDKEGVYFYNDCTDPRPTGKVIVTANTQELPGALQFAPSTLNMRAANGGFAQVQGQVTATLAVPEGYTLDGNVQLKTPLTAALFPAVESRMSPDGKTLTVTFDKALIDNNLPVGDAVPLTVSANFMKAGVQTQFVSTANVRVFK